MEKKKDIKKYDIENAKAQMKKGFLEFPVLMIIGSGESYASEILSQLKEAELLVVEGTLYPLLSRLKRFDLLDYSWKESRSGPPRKYYKLTKEGGRTLESLREAWTELEKTIISLEKKHNKK